MKFWHEVDKGPLKKQLDEATKLKGTQIIHA